MTSRWIVKYATKAGGVSGWHVWDTIEGRSGPVVESLLRAAVECEHRNGAS